MKQKQPGLILPFFIFFSLETIKLYTPNAYHADDENFISQSFYKLTEWLVLPH